MNQYIDVKVKPATLNPNPPMYNSMKGLSGLSLVYEYNDK